MSFPHFSAFCSSLADSRAKTSADVLSLEEMRQRAASNPHIPGLHIETTPSAAGGMHQLVVGTGAESDGAIYEEAMPNAGLRGLGRMAAGIGTIGLGTLAGSAVGRRAFPYPKNPIDALRNGLSKTLLKQDLKRTAATGAGFLGGVAAAKPVMNLLPPVHNEETFYVGRGPSSEEEAYRRYAEAVQNGR